MHLQCPLAAGKVQVPDVDEGEKVAPSGGGVPVLGGVQADDELIDQAAVVGGLDSLEVVLAASQLLLQVPHC